jgi:hypothetical protein
MEGSLINWFKTLGGFSKILENKPPLTFNEIFQEENGFIEDPNPAAVADDLFVEDVKKHKPFFTPVVDHCFKIKVTNWLTWTNIKWDLKRSYAISKVNERVWGEKYEYVIYIQKSDVLIAIRIYSDEKLKLTDVYQTIDTFNRDKSFLEEIGIKEFRINNREQMFKIKPVPSDDVEKENFNKKSTICGEGNMYYYKNINFTRCDLLGIEPVFLIKEPKSILSKGKNLKVNLNEEGDYPSNNKQVRFFEKDFDSDDLEKDCDNDNNIEKAVDNYDDSEKAVDNGSSSGEAVDNESDPKEAGDDNKASNNNIRVVEAPQSLASPAVPISNMVKPKELSKKEKTRISELKQAIANQPWNKEKFQKQINDILSGKSRK